MRLRKLGGSGLEVTEFCLGAMAFGNPRIGVDAAEGRRVLDAYFDRGGNFVDTADAYSGGASEEIVGAALAGRRDRVILATKGFYPVTAEFGDAPDHANALGASRRHLTLALEASLRRLRTDSIDLYQVHCWDAGTPLEETLSTLDGFVRSGKVRYLGLSNYAAWHVSEARHLAARRGFEPFVTAQMQYSLACRDIELDVIPACRHHGIGLLPWSPLCGGVLTGKYRGAASATGTRFGGTPANARLADWQSHFLNPATERVVDRVVEVAGRLGTTPTAVSLAWLLARESVSSVVIGPKTVAQLEQNLAASDLALTPADTQALDDVSRPPQRYPDWFLAGAPRSG